MNFFDSSDEENNEIIMNTYKRRKIREKSNPFDLPDQEFCKNFRVSKEVLKMILDTINLPYSRKNHVPPVLQVCATLHLLATGGYEVNVGFNRMLGMAQTTVSKFFRRTLDCIEVKLCPRWIQFEPQHFDGCRRFFFEKYKLPGVVGCVDGTHISMIKPSKDEHIYFNRKGFHSLNVMIISNHKNEIVALDCTNPGASHDSFVWNKSSIHTFLKRKYEEEHVKVRLLGDSGYPHSPWLLTPYRKATEGSPEMNFNYVHSKARSTVERTIGILKGRWRCLSSDRKLRFSPETVGKIINSCAALHNICKFYNVPDVDINNLLEPSRNVEIEPNGTSNNINDSAQKRAIVIRNRIRDSL